MNYDQLKGRHPAFTDRYFPDLSNKSNAFSALQVVNADPQATDADKQALREYVGTHTTASTYNYRWCEECESMVGHAEHTHCPRCTYPCCAPPAPIVGATPAIHIAPCGNCGDCCRQLGHRHCPTCNAHSERLCRHCGKCSGCCACLVCPQCNEMQECADCHKCYDHCSCPTLKTNGIHGKCWPAFKASERKLFDCDRLAGVEWEYNRVRNARWMNHWLKKWLGDLHQDASCGMEAVTAPIAGDYMVKCVTALGTVFEKSATLIDDRCSIHTHVDAKDLKWADMFRLLKVYSIVEPILYLLAGQDRLDNRYCLPIGKEFAAALERVDRKDAVMAVAFSQNNNPIYSAGKTAQRGRPGKRADNFRNCRRRGLNILPWLAGRIKLVGGKRVMAADTTVEFRLHSNTMDTTRVINWVKVVVRLVDWCAKHTDKEVENLPKSPLRILCQHIAPECAPWILERFKLWRKETSRTRGSLRRRISYKNGKYTY